MMTHPPTNRPGSRDAIAFKNTINNMFSKFQNVRLVGTITPTAASFSCLSLRTGVKQETPATNSMQIYQQGKIYSDALHYISNLKDFIFVDKWIEMKRDCS